MATPLKLTRTHRILIGVVVAGAVVIAAIGFAGSYAAVRELALKKGFGDFAYFFPIGIDAGICVLLALDLLLTWMRIPFPLLRQTAWLLTAATIAFNGAAAWPDSLGVGMHAVIPVLFVVAVEAARHAVGRIADITADKHMEGVRLTRWLLSPLPTFLLWRRMKLWELRSYEQVIKLEQERLVYQARLRSRFGRAWRRKAPVESLMPLRLAKYGVPLAETARPASRRPGSSLSCCRRRLRHRPPRDVSWSPRPPPRLRSRCGSRCQCRSSRTRASGSCPRRKCGSTRATTTRARRTTPGTRSRSSRPSSSRSRTRARRSPSQCQSGTGTAAPCAERRWRHPPPGRRRPGSSCLGRGAVPGVPPLDRGRGHADAWRLRFERRGRIRATPPGT